NAGEMETMPANHRAFRPEQAIAREFDIHVPEVNKINCHFYIQRQKSDHAIFFYQAGSIRVGAIRVHADFSRQIDQASVLCIDWPIALCKRSDLFLYLEVFAQPRCIEFRISSAKVKTIEICRQPSILKRTK